VCLLASTRLASPRPCCSRGQEEADDALTPLGPGVPKRAECAPETATCEPEWREESVARDRGRRLSSFASSPEVVKGRSPTFFGPKLPLPRFRFSSGCSAGVCPTDYRPLTSGRGADGMLSSWKDSQRDRNAAINIVDVDVGVVGVVGVVGAPGATKEKAA